MLNFLNHFSVPGVEHVMVYHDDQRTDVFYIVPELPSILRHDNGSPSFNLISFAHDFSLLANEASELPTAETEGGLLQLTTSLEVTAEDQEKIRSYIARGMSGALRPAVPWSGADARPSRHIAQHQADVSDVGRRGRALLPLSQRRRHVRQGVAGLREAVARVQQPGVVHGAARPRGLRLIRNSIEDGWSPGTINYDVSFVARIPNLTVTVKGNSRDVYEEIKEHSTITETYRSGNRTSTYRYPQVSSLEEIRDLFTGLHIEYDKGDFRSGGGGAEDPTATIENLVFTIVQQLITHASSCPGSPPA